MRRIYSRFTGYEVNGVVIGRVFVTTKMVDPVRTGHICAIKFLL